MAARPNTARTLQYGVTLADTQIERLQRAVQMAEYAIETNKLLTSDEIASYKEAASLCKKQSVLFNKILELKIPSNLIPATSRRPGRPSAKELEVIQKARSGKGKTKAVAKTAESKKRGRPAKAAEASEKAAKKRGRPAKAAETASATTTVVKRRGRPPKAKAVTADVSTLNGASTHSAEA